MLPSPIPLAGARSASGHRAKCGSSIGLTVTTWKSEILGSEI